MPKFFSRIPKTDPAQARYPAAMAGLLTLGQPGPDTAYNDWADRLRDHVADLVRMVLDDDLNERKSNDPAVWAPIHALRILKLLGPAEAAEPLLECMDWEDDWLEEELPPVYGAIGPSAIPLLKAYLEDTSHDAWGRGRASSSLAAIAQAHPAVRGEIVALLTAFLDRPGADASVEEETLTSLVISALGDLKATASYDAIRRAFEEDRVSPEIVRLEDIERDFGMRPPLDFSQPPEPRQEPGVRLTLKCNVCGREREHVFNKVYYDLGTMEDKRKREKYDPLIIPERVVCPKCGAVDQYELSATSYLALISSTLAEFRPELGPALPPDQRITFLTFTTRWGKMHPQEAIERYKQEIGRHPNDESLHIGLGNTYRTIGRLDEAQVEYDQAVALAPDNPEAWISLAQLAGLRKDIPEAIRCWQEAAKAVAASDLSDVERAEISQAIHDSLEDLKRGVIPEFSLPLYVEEKKPLPVPGSPRKGDRPMAPRPVPPARLVPPEGPGLTRQPKVGRNDPCPCGSGKKYKHCHGRKG